MSGLIVGEGLDTPYGRLMAHRIKELAAYGSAEKLLYGTDWPLAEMSGYIKFVRELGFTDAEQERIFYKNAKELFKL
jgi:predicted TIM-barrel fold metal-dependent hydrolase